MKQNHSNEDYTSDSVPTYNLWQYIKSYIKWLPRKLLLPLMPKYEFHHHLPELQGYVAKNGKSVIYGKHYSKLYYWGMIK